MAGNLSSFNTDLASVIRGNLDTVLMKMCTCMPGKIVAYDSATQYADVEVQLLQKFSDGSLVPYPVIPNVPVKHPRANDGAAFIHMPLQPGDDVVLVFAQRSLDNWKTQGGMSDPDDPRKFNITDCFALIGGSAMPDAFSPSTTDSIEIVNGSTAVVVHPGGKFSATNDQGELVDILDQITAQVQETANTLSTDKVNTLLGPQPLLGFATYASVASELSSLKSLLESFKV